MFFFLSLLFSPSLSLLGVLSVDVLVFIGLFLPLLSPLSPLSPLPPLSLSLLGVLSVDVLVCIGLFLPLPSSYFSGYWLAIGHVGF